MITFQESSTTRRLPSCFREATDSSQGLPVQELFCPPASSKEDEYHILKFYSFSSMIVNAALNNTSVEVDFPFCVTDLEHAIINLQPKPPSSILLLGRSGTGEYRIYTNWLQRLFPIVLANVWSRRGTLTFELCWLPVSIWLGPLKWWKHMK